MMSSVYDDPKLLERLLQECITPVVRGALSGDPKELDLSPIDEEAFFRQAGGIARSLAPLVEEASDGKYTIRRADPAIVDSQSTLHHGGAYFVRCAADASSKEPVTEPSDDMVLCEVNRYRHKLTIGLPIKPQEQINRTMAERAAGRKAEEARQVAAKHRREVVDAEYQRIIERVQFSVNLSEDHEIHQAWERLLSPHNVHRGAVTLKGLLEICERLGMDLTTIVTPVPSPH